MPKNIEDGFDEDLEKAEDAIEEALDRLTEVPAYVLTPKELEDLKAAQYALRNLREDTAEYRKHDVPSVYQ